jgi:hypothetical protein
MICIWPKGIQNLFVCFYISDLFFLKYIEVICWGLILIKSPQMQLNKEHYCNLGSTCSDRCIFISPVICQVPKVFQDTNSSCDHLSENWQFSLSELNNSHYMASCIEEDSGTPGLHFVCFS